MKIIKRYANRKLYDTERHTYLVFRDIEDLTKLHVRFKIIDNVTKNDITAKILTTLLVERELKKPFYEDVATLRNLIMRNESVLHEF